MHLVFYLAGAVAVAATAAALTRLNAVHALLYLIVSLLAVAVVFFTLGAPFVAALEVIVYAGAIMVLFVFVVMMLNLGHRAVTGERELLTPGIWRGPAVLAVILLAEVAYVLIRGGAPTAAAVEVGPKQVGVALFGPYVIGVELASLLLLSGLVGAWRLGSRTREIQGKSDVTDSYARGPAAGGDLVRAGADRPARAS